MNILSRLIATSLLASAATLGPPSQGQAQDSGLELGLLSCTVEGGFGLLFGSSRDMDCVFNPADSNGIRENYVGTINKLGLDIGISGKSYIRWIVVAAENHIYDPGGLQGTYSGATASAAFAVGLGANVLVGGSADSVALQPVSVQGQTGVNLAVGVARMRLRAVQ